jgi:hypothetical protein
MPPPWLSGILVIRKSADSVFIGRTYDMPRLYVFAHDGKPAFRSRPLTRVDASLHCVICHSFTRFGGDYLLRQLVVTCGTLVKHIACQPFIIRCFCLSIRCLCIEWRQAEVRTGFRTYEFFSCRVRAYVPLRMGAQ